MGGSRTCLAVTIVGVCFVLASLQPVRSGSSAADKKAAQQDVDGKLLFEKHCDTCHGKDGGKTLKAKFTRVKNLADPKWQEEVSDEHIFNSISNGKGKMPAWGKRFSEPQIDALVSYVRKLKK